MTSFTGRRFQFQ